MGYCYGNQLILRKWWKLTYMRRLLFALSFCNDLGHNATERINSGDDHATSCKILGVSVQ